MLINSAQNALFNRKIRLEVFQFHNRNYRGPILLNSKIRLLAISKIRFVTMDATHSALFPVTHNSSNGTFIFVQASTNML